MDTGSLGVRTSVFVLYVGFGSYMSVSVFGLVLVKFSMVYICRLLRTICAGYTLSALLTPVMGHELLGGSVVVNDGNSVLPEGVHHLPPVMRAYTSAWKLFVGFGEILIC